MILPLITALLAFLSIVLISAGIALAPTQADRIQSRLDSVGGQERVLTIEEELEKPFTERVILPMVSALAKAMERFTPQGSAENMAHKLDLAGNPGNLTPTDFLGARGLVGLVAGALGFMFAYSSRQPMLIAALAGVVGLVIGFMLPVLYLSSLTTRRQTGIVRALPDTLDLLTITVEAGVGFDQAVERAVKKWDNPLTRELGRMLSEINMGISRRDALKNMAGRIEVQDINSFTASIIQADQLGVSIARMLRIQSDQMRTRMRQRADEQANSAGIKMLIPLVFLIFPSIFVILLGPTAPLLIGAFSAL